MDFGCVCVDGGNPQLYFDDSGTGNQGSSDGFWDQFRGGYVQYGPMIAWGLCGLMIFFRIVGNCKCCSFVVFECAMMSSNAPLEAKIWYTYSRFGQSRY